MNFDVWVACHKTELNNEIGEFEVCNLTDTQIAALCQLAYTAEDGYDDSSSFWRNKASRVDDKLAEDCLQYAKEELNRANQCHVLQNRLREEQRKRRKHQLQGEGL